MRLEFEVLWIDDQPDHIRSYSEALGRKLGDLGFELKVRSVTSLDGVADYLGKHIHDDGIDLVLVDYDLGAGATGAAAIEEIRRRFPFKEMMFYSADAPATLREVAFQAGVDGVHFSARRSLVNDALGLIENMLHRVLDVDHMRGIVMAASSDIDDDVERSLLAVYSKMTPERQVDFRQALLAQLQKKLGKWERELANAASKGTLEDLLKQKAICSAADRLKFLISELCSLWQDDADEKTKLARQYCEEVVPRRNKLAHARVQRLDGAISVIGEDGPITKDDMTGLRRELIAHRGNFRHIAVIVDVGGS